MSSLSVHHLAVIVASTLRGEVAAAVRPTHLPVT